MVKKWIIIIITSMLLLVSCILESKFVNGAFDEMVEKLYVYEQILEDSGENVYSEANVKYMENLHEEFHEKEKILKGLIWHTGLKDVEISISRIIRYVQENDRTEALVETSALIDYCEHYSLDFSITFENVM